AFACYEKEGERSLKNLLSRGNEKSIAFFIGPEGGISPREIALFEERGVPTVTLGKRILRTETASAAVLSMILYEKELLL
ncbi:MAG: RNA methyltransferase, partial [Clostridia bacterium]|nr:RNA methyltransferase [Clostridia bacterium]